MGFLKIAEDILTHLKNQFNKKSFRDHYFPESEHAFTRKRKLPLENLLSFLMFRSTKSLDLKLDEWLSKQGMPDDLVTKQAISKARQQIPAKLFYDCFKLSSELFLNELGQKKDWKGYQIYAIDATDLQIPTTEETRQEFGIVKTRFQTHQAGASAAILYDVLNDVILDGILAPYKTAERKMAKELLNSTQVEGTNGIVLFDRGYPSYEFLNYLMKKGIHFVIRIKEQSKRLQDGKEDGIIYRKWGGKNCGIRAVRVELETGTIEYLLTNIPQKKVGLEEFRDLYFMRWGIEGKYRELKSRIEIEAFSGKKSICIKQDFYISLFLSNLCSFVKNEADETIEASEKEYQTTRSYVLYQINQVIGEMLLNRRKIRETLEKVIEKSKKKRSQIRRNRKSERNLNINRRKYSTSYKPCI